MAFLFSQMRVDEVEQRISLSENDMSETQILLEVETCLGFSILQSFLQCLVLIDGAAVHEGGGGSRLPSIGS